MPGGYEYHDIYYIISMFVAESNKYPKILIFLHMAPHRGGGGKKKLQHKTNMGKNTRWNWVMLA